MKSLRSAGDAGGDENEVVMLSRFLRLRAVPRAALSGLGFGFAVLAALVVWGTVSIEHTTAGVARANQIGGVWDNALVKVSLESEAMGDYVRDHATRTLGAFASQIGSAAGDFAWLDAHAADTDGRSVQLIGRGYASYTRSLQEIVDAGRRGDTTTVNLKAAQASLGAAALRKQLSVAVQFQRVRLAQYLEDARGSSDRLRSAAAVVIAIDVSLLVMCGAILLRYQRRIEKHAQQSRHQAFHDALTGLGNRMLLDERLTEAVGRAAATNDPVALLLLDLDGFKAVNDTLGHQFGDLLLTQVARRLQYAVRGSDVVARLGGDEFAVILPGCGSVEQAETLAWTVLTALRQPADLDGTVVDVDGSIGVALCPSDSGDAHQILQHADIAMYHAKRGRLGVSTFDDAMAGADPVRPGPTVFALRCQPEGAR
jgi:diguanylate cyclase (GGDEF)-like protein